MGKIVLITGTPGVGKTTVAKMLAEKLGFTYINAGELARREELVIGRDELRKADVVDVKGLREALSRVTEEHDIVLDTHLVEVSPPEKTLVAIVLRLDPEELLERLLKRGYPHIKVRENVESEIIDACLWSAVKHLGREKVFEIDVTGKTPKAVVEEALRIVREGKGNPPGSINWAEKMGPRLKALLEKMSKLTPQGRR